jgi:hypothetical protein
MFGGQLPGPFTDGAGIGLPPYPDSLDPALTATTPDLGHWHMYLYVPEYSTGC